MNADICVYEESMDIQTSIAQLTFEDLTCKHDEYKFVVRCKKETKQLLQAGISFYSVADKEYPGYDMDVCFYLFFLRVFLLHFFQQIASFFVISSCLDQRQNLWNSILLPHEILRWHFTLGTVRTVDKNSGRVGQNRWINRSMRKTCTKFANH